MPGKKQKPSAEAISQLHNDVPLLRLARKFQRVASIVLSCIVIAAVCIFCLLLYIRSQALPVTVVSQSSQMYDIHGQLIDSFYHGQNRQIVGLQHVSPYLVQAFLAVEDHRFYDHLGIDPKGIARAVAANVKSLSKSQGSSTITMQLARNLYLNHDRTWSRKLKEMFYAVQMELQYSKDQILEQYLNQIYFGHSTYGVQAAAEMLFGKSANDLTLAESSLMAGIPKGPRYYSPYYDMDNAKARQAIILDKMVANGTITAQEAEKAKQEELNILPLQTDEPAEAPYFRDYVRAIITDQLGMSEEAFDAGGLKIYTSLDLRAQHEAEAAIEKQISEESELQAALIAIDPRNGYIKAMVGGKDYASNQFNRVLTSTRQPGSSFKPILYLAALEHGFTALSRYKSEPTVFTYDEGKQTYAPRNFNNKYENDYINMRQAIAQSDNIYAVHTMMDIGAESIISMAQRLGITSDLTPLPSLALGTSPISPLEMASAYGTIANQGVRNEPVAVLRIVNSRGSVLYEAKPNKTQAVEPADAYILTTLMQSVFEEGGTGYRVAKQFKRPVAGKSGSTNTDSWMIGFTPELATAVWVGYDRDRNISSVDSYKAAPIFAEFTENTLRSVPPKLFPIPDNIITAYIDQATGRLANDQCPQSRMEVFVAGTEPTQYCTASGNKTPPASDSKSSGPNRSFWEDLKRWWNE